MGKTKNRAIELLQEIIDYRKGNGKYNFSNLSDYERSNDSFDAWLNISEKIKEFLNKNRNA